MAELRETRPPRKANRRMGSVSAPPDRPRDLREMPGVAMARQHQREGEERPQR